MKVRSTCTQCGPHPQPRLLLVAHDAPRKSARRPASRSGCYTELPLEDMALLAAKKALAKSGRTACGNWRRPVLHLHQHQAHSVGCHLAFG